MQFGQQKMESIMNAQGTWEAIEPTVGVAVDERENKVARAFIFQAIPKDMKTSWCK